MDIRTRLLKLFVPSNWIKVINGNKTYLGLIALALWAAIYAVPAVCATEICAAIAAAGQTVHQFLISIGINLSAELLNLASALTLVGLADKLAHHKITKVLLGLLRLIEEPIGKLIQKGDDHITSSSEVK